MKVIRQRYFPQAILLATAGLFFLLSFFTVSYADSVYQSHTEVELIPEYTTLHPGDSFWIALRMKMDDHWHTYWKNPGDSGLATSIEWDLPEGFQASEIYWPYPERITIEHLASYGYEGDVVLLSKIQVPKDVPETVEIKATVNWLACRIECLPGVAEFQLYFSKVDSRPTENPIYPKDYDPEHPFFPLKVSKDWVIKAKQNKQNIFLHFESLSNSSNFRTSLKGFYFFAEKEGVIDHAKNQNLSKTSRGYVLQLPKSSLLEGKEIPSISGVLVSDLSWEEGSSHKALAVDIPVDNLPTTSLLKNSQASMNIGIAIWFAFLGGLILNVMPCVLPVLAIKVLGLIEQSAKDKNRVVHHSILFSLGIIVTFWILNAFILLFQFAGKQVGWGFQFQSPVFVVLMAILFFGLALNLFGVFEVGTSFSRLGGVLRNSFLSNNAFANGVLATIVATPCTAPFMGSALGFALVQPEVSFLIFTFLGLGMAFPYLLLSYFPSLLRYIPKPGPWMIKLRKFFGVLFLATVVWLCWVLVIQRGLLAGAALLVGLIFIGLAANIFRRKQILKEGDPRYQKLHLLVIIFVVLGIVVAIKGSLCVGQRNYSSMFDAPTQSIKWVDFSEEHLAILRAENKSVFLNFTAAWCLSCQVNEKIVFSNSKVIQAFEKSDVVAMKADWSNYDESVTQALARFGKASIPFYVLYPGKENHKPVFLPEVITPNIMLEFLEKNIME